MNPVVLWLGEWNLILSFYVFLITRRQSHRMSRVNEPNVPCCFTILYIIRTKQRRADNSSEISPVFGVLKTLPFTQFIFALELHADVKSQLHDMPWP